MTILDNTASTSNQPEPVRKSSLQSDITTYVRITKPVPIFKSKELDTQILRMIVKRYYPFSILKTQNSLN